MNTNDSLNNTSTYPQTNSIWILCETVSLVLSIFTAYLFCALVVTATRSKRNQTQRFNGDTESTDPNTVTGDSHNPGFQSSVLRTRSERGKGYRRSERGKGYRHLLLSLTICVFMNLLRCVDEQLLFFIGPNSTKAYCDILSKFTFVLGGLALHTCFIFLWLRQLMFYSHSLLGHLASKKLKIASYTAYLFMLITLFLVMALCLCWRDYDVIDGNCQGAGQERYAQVYIFVTLVVCTISIQSLLSALFLYPIIMNTRNKRAMALENCHARKTSKEKSLNRLQNCIVRTLKAATVGITTDILSAIAGIFIPWNNIPMFVMSVLYNCNITLNIICITYTFKSWKQIVFPYSFNILC